VGTARRAASVVPLPVRLLTIIVQKAIVAALTRGGVKGA
jgi:ABC-type maltose transport system permease subunit